jgi:hypothetical protein
MGNGGAQSCPATADQHDIERRRHVMRSVERNGPLLRGEEFLFQNPAVVVNDFAGDAAVVVLMLDADASALVVGFLSEQGLVVAVFVVVRIDDLAAGRLQTREVVASDGHHSPS